MKKPKGFKKTIVGLTGSFGSGKSTVAAIFKKYKAAVIDADAIGHGLFARGQAIYRKTVREFGQEILDSDKAIDRKKLGRLVFNNPGLLKKLDRLVHPEIIRLIKARINASRAKIVVVDAPLLIEAGLRNLTDKVVVVTASRDTQIKRIQKKTGLTRSDILKRIKSQIPLKKKILLADFVIDNNSTLNKTEKQVNELRRMWWRK